MAPRRTPRKEKAPLNYSAVGFEGRRTGLTLKDTGVRDENGFEPIPSFSSPAKPVIQSNGITHDATISADDSMDIDEGENSPLNLFQHPYECAANAMFHPGDQTGLVQSTRKGRISLPPRATSPIKTHLNSSPRRSMPRSMGLMSSPSRHLNNGTPTRAISHPPLDKPVNRRLDFSPENLRESVERSPQGAPASDPSKADSTSNSGKGKGKAKAKRIFDLTGNGGSYEDSDADALDEAPSATAIIYDDDSLILDGTDHPLPDRSLEVAPGDGYTQEHSEVIEVEPREPMGPPALSGARAPKRGPRRIPNTQTASNDESQVSTSVPEPPRRGRPPTKPKIYKDPDAPLPAASSPVRKTIRKPPPSLRDPNARSKVTKTANGKPPSRAGSIAAGSRFTQRHRSETPANDSGALITRSGRQSIKPLASWRGEKTVMGDRTFAELPGIKEVIRVDEVVEPRPNTRRHRSGRNRTKSRLTDVEEEAEEEEEKAPWEVDPGIMVAQVMDWDANTNRYDEESTREEDIAYAFDAIEMRDISGADFKFAKTLTLDFFGSGMVQLPPGGAKRVKNSRKMQMVFFVFYGRVTVSIGTPPTKFSIGKGGQWQVPRGNFYSITNESDTNDARIFFAQGCEIQAGAMDESTMA